MSYEFDNTRWYPLAGPTPNGLVILGPSGGRAGSVLMIDLATDPTTVVAEFKLPFAVRASMTNGTQELRWLSDSSALVVATPDGFALLGID